MPEWQSGTSRTRQVPRSGESLSLGAGSEQHVGMAAFGTQLFFMSPPNTGAFATHL